MKDNNKGVAKTKHNYCMDYPVPFGDFEGNSSSPMSRTNEFFTFYGTRNSNRTNAVEQEEDEMDKQVD